MPWGDWQFWLVTLAALWGVWALVRALVPKRRARGTRASLTVEGKKPRG